MAVILGANVLMNLGPFGVFGPAVPAAAQIVPSMADGVDTTRGSDAPPGAPSPAPPSAAAPPFVIVVVGAGGQDEFAREFQEAARRWRDVAMAANAGVLVIGDFEPSVDTDGRTDRALLEAQAREAVASPGDSPIWLVLIGHGTFDNQVAKFNLRGPDLSARELADWIAEAKRPVIVVNCSSSSGPFLGELKGGNRVVITATRSGAEQNYSRFGKFLAESIGDIASDLDKDERVSLLEAYIAAAKRTSEFYSGEGRLATEHALLDDNGDGLGTPGDWFRGTRPTRAAKEGAALDGQLAHQFGLLLGTPERDDPAEIVAERASLERAIEQLRAEKGMMEQDEYYRRLERLLVQLARLNAGY